MAKITKSTLTILLPLALILIAGCASEPPVVEQKSDLAGYWRIISDDLDCALYMFFGNEGKGFLWEYGVKKNFSYSYSDNSLSITQNEFELDDKYDVIFNGNDRVTLSKNSSTAVLNLERSYPRVTIFSDGDLRGTWEGEDILMEFKDGNKLEITTNNINFERVTYSTDGPLIRVTSEPESILFYVDSITDNSLAIILVNDGAYTCDKKQLILLKKRSATNNPEPTYTIDGNLLKISLGKEYYSLSCTDSIVISKITDQGSIRTTKMPSKGQYYLDGKYAGYRMCDLIVCNPKHDRIQVTLTEPALTGKKPCVDCGSLPCPANCEVPVYETRKLTGELLVDLHLFDGNSCSTPANFSKRISLDTEGVQTSCNENSNCEPGYLCDSSTICSMTPSGYSCGDGGDKRCHKQCTNDSDCQPPESKCAEVPNGYNPTDIVQSVKICVKENYSHWQ